ncbi:MAG: DinB family protein [Spirochaetes bacterium]|nr:DinB family protein [Spirochaetota bacterium]
MDKKVLNLLTEYNLKTNETMNSKIEKLNETEWNHKFGGYYPDIHSVCNHLYIADYNWLSRFGNLREFNYLKTRFFESKFSFSSTAFESINEYIEKRNFLDSKLSEMVSEILDDDFDKILEFRTSAGEEQKRNFGGILLHVFNHQTHHRGMISVYLESLGIENDYSNLMLMV